MYDLGGAGAVCCFRVFEFCSVLQIMQRAYSRLVSILAHTVLSINSNTSARTICMFVLCILLASS